MNINSMFQSLGVSASALTAERARMGIIANNLAHAGDTDRGDGMAYRRKEAVFSTILEGAMAGGVRLEEVREDDRTACVRVHRPGHPHADKDGMLTMPNVNASNEMVDLIIASRSYEANLKVASTTVSMAQQALQLGSA